MDSTHRTGTLTNSVAERILAEGAMPYAVAARKAGLAPEAMPSDKTFMRALIARQLEGVKVAGKWLTSAPAILRWIERAQHRREKFAPAPALTGEAADAVLEGFGLGRKK